MKLRPQTQYEVKHDAVKRFENILHERRWPQTRTWIQKVREGCEEMIAVIELAERNRKALLKAQEAFDEHSPDWREAA